MLKYKVEGRGDEDMNNEPKQLALLNNFCFSSQQQLGWRSLLSVTHASCAALPQPVPLWLFCGVHILIDCGTVLTRSCMGTGGKSLHLPACSNSSCSLQCWSKGMLRAVCSAACRCYAGHGRQVFLERKAQCCHQNPFTSFQQLLWQTLP